ncbi:basic region/leucine zipper motif 60 [Wolffia australiana]
MADGAAKSEELSPNSLDSLDGLFLDFVEIEDFALSDEISPLSYPSPQSMSPQMIWELEKFLMEDNGDVQEVNQPLPDGFFADVFSTPAYEVAVEFTEKSEEDVEPTKGHYEGTNDDDSESKGEDDEGIRFKKRRRQMKNRESAMKSRERKKMYVKELEMKSKYMSLEVKRLQRALHCCAAENMALRQSLTKPKPALAAPLAIQESAVLFVESLLLGSLYWLVSVVCLFLAPAAPPGTAGRAAGVEDAGNEEQGTWSEPELISGKRRCRALRTRMKEICSSPLYLLYISTPNFG